MQPPRFLLKSCLKPTWHDSLKFWFLEGWLLEEGRGHLWNSLAAMDLSIAPLLTTKLHSFREGPLQCCYARKHGTAKSEPLRNSCWRWVRHTTFHTPEISIYQVKSEPKTARSSRQPQSQRLSADTIHSTESRLIRIEISKTQRGQMKCPSDTSSGGSMLSQHLQ